VESIQITVMVLAFAEACLKKDNKSYCPHGRAAPSTLRHHGRHL
jgi:hypothetical protein